MSGLDELRFGQQRTLNLRERLPTAPQAVRRAEAWLRQHQIMGTKEVLVITGRGNQSAGGIPVLHVAIETLLFSLRRRGVVAPHHDHNPGAFAVMLAPLRALADAAPRRRERATPAPPAPEIHGLSRETTSLLRDLAERSLGALGVTITNARIVDEMHRHLRLIAPGLTAGTHLDEQLGAALRAAIGEYD